MNNVTTDVDRRSYHSELYDDKDRNKIAFFPGFLALKQQPPTSRCRKLNVVTRTSLPCSSIKKDKNSPARSGSKTAIKETPCDFVARILQLNNLQTDKSAFVSHSSSVVPKTKRVTFSIEDQVSSLSLSVVDKESKPDKELIADKTSTAVNGRLVLTVGHKLPTTVGCVITVNRLSLSV